MPHHIEINDLSFAYSSETPLLKEVSITVEARDFIGVVGPNGCGKSTLVKLILGLIHPTAGTVRVMGTSPEKAREQVGYVPQFANFPRDFPITVEKTVLMGRLGRTRSIGNYTDEDRQIALEVMEQLEISDLRYRPLGELSGGQLQRVLIARALVCHPKILLLDEPSSSTDPHTEMNIFDQLKRVNTELGVTILVVSHDIGFISHYVKRVICMHKKVVCHETEALTPEIMTELYGGDVRVIRHDHD